MCQQYSDGMRTIVSKHLGSEYPVTVYKWTTSNGTNFQNFIGLWNLGKELFENIEKGVKTTINYYISLRKYDCIETYLARMWS